MKTNQLKTKLQAGESTAGVLIPSSDEQLVEVLGLSGFDFVFIDCEHGHMSVRECETLVRTAEAIDIPAVVRVPHNQPDVILRHLDTGAQTIVIPQVNTVDDLNQAVEAALYHPLGRRGLAGTRAARFGLQESLSDYTRSANNEIAIIALIENVAALGHLDELLAAEHLTAVHIGPADLSQSLGRPGQRNHPDVEQAIDQIITTAVAAGVPVGINTSSGADAKAARERGCQLTTVAAWGLLAGATRGYLAEMRA